jgi:hypothetical protein
MRDDEVTYEPPALELLGSVHDLTGGFEDGDPDGLGGGST